MTRRLLCPDAPIARLLRLAQAAALHDVAEGTSYGTPSIKLRRKFLARLADPATLAIRCPLAEKEMLMAAAPDLYFETPHYHGWDSMLVRLGAIADPDLQARLERAWLMQAGQRDIARRQAALTSQR